MLKLKFVRSLPYSLPLHCLPMHTHTVSKFNIRQKTECCLKMIWFCLVVLKSCQEFLDDYAACAV